MNKKWIICIVITVIVGLCLGAGIAILSQSLRGKTEGTDITSKKELADNENEEVNNINEINTNIVETASVEEKISPNAVIIKKTYYEECDHLIRKTENIPEELVNKTKEDVEKVFPDWEIEKYSQNEITLYKSESGNCGEHYFVQDHNGVIGIYTMDKYGVKTLKEDTQIPTQYLPEEDLKTLKAGVEVIGHTKLVEFLEDYE